MPSVITGSNITRYQMLVLRSALKLEILGMHRRGTPAAQIIREVLESKTRDRRKLLEEYEAYLKEQGVVRG